ncbi:hypothetical protein H0E87_000332 [Populus deltoides]|uniref:ABC transporter domain-containing protein n=1 Tax=Populus deltoides TaxID=3696 RepID=A0A8T2ZM87_POPDE|nr:hypothetical protein H0E87_000332 [Populus deltoides]
MSSEAESITNDLSKGSNAMRAVFAILDRKSEIDPNNSLGTSNIKRKLNIQVELNNVFAYPTRPDQMIFNVLNLKIDAGKTVALVGPSGSGKYTIIGLVERFYDSLNGAVFIDLQEITSFNLRTLGSHIALVSQEQHCLLELSVKILPMVEDARESEMRRLQFLLLHKNLSGSINQSCCWTRQPALDSVSESLVQEALEKLMVGSSCVAIAHRLSTNQKSNCVAVIKKGKVAEQGCHKELLALGRDGAYYFVTEPQTGSSLFH